MEAFQWVLGTYGKEMVCYNGDETVAGRGPAIVQPMTEADRQYAAGELDEGRDTFLGLTGPDFPLDSLGQDGFLSWEGQDFELVKVRPIQVGGQTTHLWLALRPRSAERSEE